MRSMIALAIHEFTLVRPELLSIKVLLIEGLIMRLPYVWDSSPAPVWHLLALFICEQKYFNACGCALIYMVVLPSIR